MVKSLKDINEFERFIIGQMAYDLLNISFDTDEWDEKFLDNALEETINQLVAIKRQKESGGIADTTIYLYDLLTEAFTKGYFDNE